LILVDSSVWIDFLSSRGGYPGAELRRMIQDNEPLAVTGVVITEVLQGLIRNLDTLEQLLAQFEILEPNGLKTYSTAAAMYRIARGKGISLTTIDTIIAAIALENGASVFTLDPGFSRIAQISPLVLYGL
jgi:predicted nucleic acid-binding protein